MIHVFIFYWSVAGLACYGMHPDKDTDAVSCFVYAMTLGGLVLPSLFITRFFNRYL